MYPDFPISSVCFIRGDFSWRDEYILRCRIEIGEGQTINIPTGMVIRLEDDAGFDLTGNGSIKGENYARSVIKNTNNGPAIKMGGYGPNDDKCQGCQVSDISIEGADSGNPISADGITITEDSEMNDVTSVRFVGLRNGITVKGDCNTFNNLSFFQVATDLDDCIVTPGDPAAILLEDAHQNVFTNINHTQSIGANSIRMQFTCTNNRILNLSVEQENSPCADPAIHVDRGGSCKWNYFVTNFNGATYKIVTGQSIFEENNIMLPWINPSTTNLTACIAPACGNP